MMAQRSPENEGPLTWIGNFPVYVSTALAGVHGLTLILTALAMAAGAEGFLQAFVFSSQAVTKDYSLWQICTYAFVHRPSYWLLLVELYLLVAFGREIETYLGRQSFVKLYTGLLITPPLVLAAAGWAGWPSIYWGSSALHFGIFVAFALLYPTAEILFSIQARWVALALLLPPPPTLLRRAIEGAPPPPPLPPQIRLDLSHDRRRPSPVLHRGTSPRVMVPVRSNRRPSPRGRPSLAPELTVCVLRVRCRRRDRVWFGLPRSCLPA